MTTLDQETDDNVLRQWVVAMFASHETHHEAWETARKQTQAELYRRGLGRKMLKVKFAENAA